MDEKNLPGPVDTRKIFFEIYGLTARVMERLEEMPDTENEEAACLIETYLTLTGLLKLLAPYLDRSNRPDPPEALPS